MIKPETAQAIAVAYVEVETAEKLLAEITEDMKNYREPDIRDAFGRQQGGLQLGVPHGANGRRLFNVAWTLARPVIEAHIANQLRIPVYFGEAPVILTCFIRKEIKDEVLKIGYSISRAENERQAEFQRIVGVVAGATELTTLFGTPS